MAFSVVVMEPAAFEALAGAARRRARDRARRRPQRRAAGSCSTRSAAAPAMPCAGPRPTARSARISPTLPAAPRSAPASLPNDRDALVRWIAQTEAIKPGVAHALVRRAAGRATSRRSPPISRGSNERSGARAVDADRARREAQAERLLKAWETPQRLALLVGGEQHRGRPLVHRDRVLVHAVRRRACALDARPARGARQRFSRPPRPTTRRSRCTAP